MSGKRRREVLAEDVEGEHELGNSKQLPLRNRAGTDMAAGDCAVVQSRKRVKHGSVQVISSHTEQIASDADLLGVPQPSATTLTSRDSSATTPFCGNAMTYLLEGAETLPRRHTIPNPSMPQARGPVPGEDGGDESLRIGTFETVADILRRYREDAKQASEDSSHSDVQQASAPGTGRRRGGLHAPTSEQDDADETDGSADEVRASSTSVGVDVDMGNTASNETEYLSCNLRLKKHSLHQIAVKYQAPLESLLKPAMLGKRSILKWDVKLIQALADLSSYVTHETLNELLWAKVGERKGQSSAKKSVVKKTDVYAVIVELEDEGWQPQTILEGNFTSRNAIDKIRALDEIAAKHNAGLEDLLDRAMQPNKPVMGWDVKLLKPLAKLSAYVAHQDMNRLLWAKVCERKGQEDPRYSVIRKGDVWAVINDLDEQGHEAEATIKRDSHAEDEMQM
ncbi:hypothetical protein LTR53_017047 [Teratosphaeriaceae sp. CCFEE 6253]|nr:hypothetical protein LTR53_017047 [Teratosphaeriaceae sp. CCFEE 6253]